MENQVTYGLPSAVFDVPFTRGDMTCMAHCVRCECFDVGSTRIEVGTAELERFDALGEQMFFVRLTDLIWQDDGPIEQEQKRTCFFMAAPMMLALSSAITNTVGKVSWIELEKRKAQRKAN